MRMQAVSKPCHPDGLFVYRDGFMRLLAAAVAALPLMAWAQSTDFDIVGVTVLVGDGRQVENALVRVREGKIASVLPGGSAPSGIPVVNGAGKYLYPGFIDSYSTRLTKTAPEPNLDGRPDATTQAPPTMWAGNLKGIFGGFSAAENLDFDRDNSSFENGITTTLLVPNKGSIRGSAALVNLLPATEKERILNPEVGFGLSYRAGAGSGYPSNILGVIALMRQTLADAKSTADGADVGAPAAALKGLQSLAPLVTGKKPGIFESNFDREIERSMRLAEEFGFKFMVAGGRDAHKVAPMLKLKGIPVLLQVDYLDQPTVTPDGDSVAPADRQPLEYKQERLARWEEQIKGSQVLAGTGVDFAFSSGTQPSQYLKNVRRLIKQGLSKEAALKAMTVTPAKLFGASDKVGSIESGKLANLVLMSGPFESDSSVVETVWISGKMVTEPKEAGK